MPKLKLASTTEVQIEKGIPLPPARHSAWPLRTMEVGDSFPFDRSRLSAVRSAIGYETRVSHGKKFTTRVLPTEARCWRLA